MKNLLILAVAFSALIGCQKPDLSSSPLPVGTKTNCVGGGCSDAARSNFNTTIDQNGNIWHSSKEDLLKKDPTQDGPKSWWNSTADTFFSPGSTVNKPETGSVPLPKDPDDSDTNIVDGSGETTSGPSSNPGDGPDDMKVPPKKGNFSDSDLGKGLRLLGSNLGAAWGEITGANQKKRKKAKELKKQVNEAKDIGNQISLMVDDMNTNAAAIQAAGKEIMKGDRFTRTGEIRGVTNGLAGDQNTRGNRIIDDTTDIGEEVTVPVENPLDNTPELRSIKEARSYLGYVERKIEGMDQAPVRKAIVRYSSSALDSAEAAYRSGNNAKGDLYKSLAVGALDVALSLTPGIGLGKDIYEAYYGVNLLTGVKLTKFERTMACVGILTVGYGSKVALLGKASVVVDFLKTGAKEAEAVAEVTRAVTKAEEIVIAAEKAGVKEGRLIDEIADVVKKDLPCKVAMISPIDRLLLFFEEQAYAVDCDLDEAEKALKSAFEAAEEFKFDIKSLNTGKKGDNVLVETLNNKGNVTSKYTLTADEALETGNRWVGSRYKEIGQPGSGVYRSEDGLRQFRMDKNSLAGSHAPGTPHVHFETYRPGANKFEANNHVPIIN